MPVKSNDLVSLHIKIPRQLHERIAACAASTGDSMASWCRGRLIKSVSTWKSFLDLGEVVSAADQQVAEMQDNGAVCDRSACCTGGQTHVPLGSCGSSKRCISEENKRHVMYLGD